MSLPTGPQTQYDDNIVFLRYTDIGVSVQGWDTTLDALASLTTTLGLVEQTSSNVFGIRLLGVGASTSIPTRADADLRYAAISHTHPSTEITDFNEAAQDAVGGILSSEFTYTDGSNTIEVNAISYTKITGLGTLATQNGTFSGTSSGTNTGDQTITLTSDVTGSGTGSFATTIAAGVVTLAKMADMATTSIIGRKTAGTGVPEVLSASDGRTVLGLGTLATQNGTFSGTSSGTNTGDQNVFTTIVVSGQDNVVTDSTTDTLTLVAGANVTITTDAATDSITIASSGGGGGGTLADGDYGDVTASGSGTTITIDNGVVSYAKMQDVSDDGLILGRISSGAGDVEELDAADVSTILGLGTLATQDGTFSGTSSGTNTGDQLVFTTIAVSGQSDVVADSGADTLTLAVGDGVTLTTNADTITITNTNSMGVSYYISKNYFN